MCLLSARPALRPDRLTPAAWTRPPEPPRPGRPRVWLARVEDLRGALAPLAGTLLDSGERARAAALHRAADRDGYRVVHVCLRLLLGAYLGVEPSDVTFVRRPCPVCRGPHGRPDVPGVPLCFSVSRTDGRCLLAFADTPIGADIERLPGSDVVAALTDTLHPREAAELAACPPQGRPAAFARVWTRKEAYLKGLGTGLGRDLRSDHLGASARGPRRMPGWTVDDVAVGRGHAAAVAVAER
ncbi:MULTISPECIES: 4'-phosphopantetheinyl transferase family protein [Streptomyces]|uniref:4'-phosphopantetheinyl transferase family protein n=1 Tax=Streptomyces TaxID=1883 RepID=UPI00287F635A|nr:4'-phosphopantetheinyl transferase superfamily protein [Streptomyces sp. CGMCC 4.1456]WNF62474.1 4'-phosphopantetheinyl transferase superfamily protein [Streptomyces sp. CGMCC 4.1456]